MSQPLPPPPCDGDEALAAELALGLLPEAEAEAVIARLATEPDFAARVRRWQECLAPLAGELVPVMAPVRTRQHLREALGHVAAPLSLPLEGGGRARWPWLALVAFVLLSALLLAVL